MAGPILRISCNKEVEFQESVTVQLPLSLREKKDSDLQGIPDLSSVRVRVLFQQSDGEQREWTDITGSLESPPSFDRAVIKFVVKHFSGYAKATVLCLYVCIVCKYLLHGISLFMHLFLFFKFLTIL